MNIFHDFNKFPKFVTANSKPQYLYFHATVEVLATAFVITSDTNSQTADELTHC